jgi:ABC-type branched-subunit amino acid transport system ATPase component
MTDGPGLTHTGLRIQNLSKRYGNGVQALQDVSLHIGSGMFGLLGPNGAGKSTSRSFRGHGSALLCFTEPRL